MANTHDALAPLYIVDTTGQLYRRTQIKRATETARYTSVDPASDTLHTGNAATRVELSWMDARELTAPDDYMVPDVPAAPVPASPLARIPLAGLMEAASNYRQAAENAPSEASRIYWTTLADAAKTQATSGR